MALSVSQILASSYPKVLATKPENQWQESAAMRLLEKYGLIERVNGSPIIEASLDYKMNEGADFLSTDFDPVSLAKTDVITAAQYTPVPLQVPITWSKADEAKNPDENQKIDLVASLLDNGFASHDEMIEQKLFATSAYKGFNSIPVIIPTGGQGTIGGIDASTETWWRNPASLYNSNFSDIEAVFTTVYNNIIKGTGSKKTPKVMIGTADAHAGFEGTQVSLQRWVDGKEANAGFESLRFKNVPFGFSQQVDTTYDPVYFLSDAFRLVTFKNAYRKKGEVRELESATGYICQIFSMLQTRLNNKARVGVASHS